MTVSASYFELRNRRKKVLRALGRGESVHFIIMDTLAAIIVPEQLTAQTINAPFNKPTLAYHDDFGATIGWFAYPATGPDHWGESFAETTAQAIRHLSWTEPRIARSATK